LSWFRFADIPIGTIELCSFGSCKDPELFVLQKACSEDIELRFFETV